jgi:hypothetical protein
MLKIVRSKIQVNLQWLQNPSDVNGDDLNDVKCEASWRFNNKRKEYLKDETKELAANCKNKNIRDLCRGINECKRCYQPGNNLVKDENGDLLADSHIIFNRWKNCFSQLLNVLNNRDVRQTEVHTPEPLVSDPSRLGVENAIAKLTKFKSQGRGQIPAELIQTGGEMLLFSVQKLINSIWNEEELHDDWKESITVPGHEKCGKTDCNNYRGMTLLSTSYQMLSNILLSRLSPYVVEIIGDHHCGFH